MVVFISVSCILWSDGAAVAAYACPDMSGQNLAHELAYPILGYARSAGIDQSRANSTCSLC